MVYADELNRMQVEIGLGWDWGHPDTRVPQTDEHRAAWQRLAEQIREIEAHGHEVQIPNE